MPCAPILRFGDRAATESRAEVGEVMSGVLEVIRGSASMTSSSSSSTTSRLPSTTTNVHRRLGSTSTAATTSGSSSSIDGLTSCQRVFVRVYRTSSEHFAVLYPVRAIVTACRPLASLNLKSCCVKPLPGTGREFRVSPRSCEGVSVTFRALEGSSEVQMSEWLQAFSDVVKDGGSLRRKKISEHRSPLPVLEESEEDASED